MKLKYKFSLGNVHNESDVEVLKKEYNYTFTKEHLEFIRKFPGLYFEGSRIVKINTKNNIGTSIIHNFLSASDICYVLGDEAIMEAFEDLSLKKIGSYCILAFSHTETEIFIVGSDKNNENDVYIYSAITDELVLICNGIENFINNYLYLRT